MRSETRLESALFGSKRRNVLAKRKKSVNGKMI
jgi:hypothetical protein